MVMNCSKQICAQMHYLYGFRAITLWPSIAFSNGLFCTGNTANPEKSQKIVNDKNYGNAINSAGIIA